MARLRLNNLGASALANALTVSAGSTSVSFVSNPGFPTIAFPDYLPVTVDPGLSTEEIIWITAWTAGATSGTCFRNVEPTQVGQNTTAAHTAVGWSHSPTSLDYGKATPTGLNITPLNLPVFREAVANVQAGLGSAKILSIGTSITGGGGVTQVSTGAPTAYLAKMLNANLCPTQQTLCALTPYSTNGTQGDTARVSLGTGWSLPATNGANAGIGWANNGYVQGALSAAGNFVFTPDPTEVIDTFDVWCYSATNTGTVQGSVDGGSNTALVTNNATAAFRKFTVSCTRGTGHVLTLGTITVDPVYIIAIDAYDSTTPSLHIGNAGVDGLGTSAAWATPSAVAAIEYYNPQLTLIELGGDDTLLATPPSQSTFYTNLQTVVAAAKNGGGDVLLWSQAMPNPAAAGITTAMINDLISYIQAIEYESINSNIAYADLTSRWVSYAVSNPYGYYAADGVHPSASGNADIAAILFEALETVTNSSPSTNAVPAWLPLVQEVSNAASSVTPVSTNNETHWITSATGTITINNPTGTPVNGQKLLLRVKTSGGAETYSWGSAFRGSTAAALPGTSSNNKWDYFGFEYNTTDSKWDLIAVNQGF